MTLLRRIIIIGGGLGGLATAIALCRKDFEVNVYEQASALGEVGAGINVGPNGVKAFRYLGLEADLNQIGFVPTGRANRHLRTGRLIHTIPLRNIVERFGAQFILTHRADLLELLARRVQESSLHLGYRCVGVDQSGDLDGPTRPPATVRRPHRRADRSTRGWAPSGVAASGTG